MLLHHGQSGISKAVMRVPGWVNMGQFWAEITDQSDQHRSESVCTALREQMKREGSVADVTESALIRMCSAGKVIFGGLGIWHHLTSFGIIWHLGCGMLWGNHGESKL